MSSELEYFRIMIHIYHMFSFLYLNVYGLSSSKNNTQIMSYSPFIIITIIIITSSLNVHHTNTWQRPSRSMEQAPQRATLGTTKAADPHPHPPSLILVLIILQAPNHILDLTQSDNSHYFRHYQTPATLP